MRVYSDLSWEDWTSNRIIVSLTLLLSSRLGLFGLTETDADINSCTQLKIIREKCLSVIDKYGISAILRPPLYKCGSSLLGPVFDRIRFPLMKIPELVTVNRSDLALNKSEYELILSYLLDNPKPPIHFPITPRSPSGMVAERSKSSKMVMFTSYPQEFDLEIDYSPLKVSFTGPELR
uniref:Uncharacterized protein n=1 Tax=Tetranychus urticae TaxID=32264 RepID=T1KL47_TETUR